MFLTSYKEIFKYVTDFSLGTLGNQGFFEAFHLLPEYCSRLSNLFLRTSQELSREPSQEYSQQDTTYLRSLKNFRNLPELHICTSHGLDLLKHCIFPKSLRHLTLSFTVIDWEKFIDGPSSLVAFDRQPENLQNLETLGLYLTDLPHWIGKEQFSHNHHLAIEIFIEDLLKKIPICKKLNLALSYKYSFEYIFKASPFIFDFSRFLKSIEHLSQSLEVLNISDQSLNYCLADFKIQPVAFPKLSRLSIFTEIPLSVEFNSIFNIVQTQGSVKLEVIRVKSCEALLNLLRKVGEMKNANVDKRVELVIYAEVLDTDEEFFEKNFECVKKEIGRPKNIFLLIEIGSNFEFIKELESFQPLFGDLKVHKDLD